jgi:predicted RNA polymerase sigma factor
MIRFKYDVSTTLFKEPVVRAMNVASRVFGKHDKIAWVTCLEEGKHMKGSLHYKGLAVDFRRRFLTKEQVPLIAGQMAAILGADYDVVVKKDHIHVEYDPKDT